MIPKNLKHNLLCKVFCPPLRVKGDCIIKPAPPKSDRDTINISNDGISLTINMSRAILMLKLNRFLDSNEFACHTCDRAECINPSHIYLGNPKSNVLDKNLKGLRYKEEHKCKTTDEILDKILANI